MNKQQAAEHRHPYAPFNTESYTDYLRKCFIEGWEAREALLSPIDLVDFMENAITFNAWCEYEGWQYEGDDKWWKPKGNTTVNSAELYQLFNPSGAAPQVVSHDLITAVKWAIKELETGENDFGAGLDDINNRLKAALNSTPAPPAAGRLDFKGAIRQMMESTNKLLLSHLPQLSGTDRALVQVAVMDEFFAVFGRGTDLEELAEQYNKIKPNVL